MTSNEQKAAKLKVVDTEIIARLQEGQDIFSNRGCLVKIKRVDVEKALAGFWTRLSEGDKEYDFGSRLANTKLKNNVCLFTAAVWKHWDKPKVWAGGLREDFWRHLFWRDMCRVPEKINESEQAGENYHATKSYIERWPNVGDFPEQWFIWGRNNRVTFEEKDKGFIEFLVVGFESELKMFCEYILALMLREQDFVFVASAIPFILMAHEKNLVEDDKVKVFIERCEKTWNFADLLLPQILVKIRNVFEKNLLAKVIKDKAIQPKVRLAL